MIRLNMVAEGHAEETFAREVLKEPLAERAVFLCVRRVQTGRTGPRVYRGGMTSYEKAKNDLERWLKEDKGPDARFTTMFDLYGLPRDFPGYQGASQQSDPFQRWRTHSAIETYRSRDPVLFRPQTDRRPTDRSRDRPREDP